MDSPIERLFRQVVQFSKSINPRMTNVIATNGEIVEPNEVFNRSELLTKLLTTLIGLAASFTVTYFGVKWLSNVIDPTKQEKVEAQRRAQKLMEKIGVSNVQLTEYELCIASNLIDPLSLSLDWSEIAGLEETVQDIKETVILPFKRNDIFKTSKLLKAPKGVLLYGPPGCGKTMIAKATAKEAGARFINLQISSLVDKWYGESQKRAEAVFSLAIKIQPTIIFIDEIDSFLRSRTSSDHEATAMIKTQFMSWWDGLLTDDNYQVMIIGATNRPQDVDAAILRRMPCMFNIGLPISIQRKQILKLMLDGEDVEDTVDLASVAERTDGFSGSDLRELCRLAAVCRIRDYMKHISRLPESTSKEECELRAISMEDFDTALSKLKQSKFVSHNITVLPDLD